MQSEYLSDPFQKVSVMLSVDLTVIFVKLGFLHLCTYTKYGSHGRPLKMVVLTAKLGLSIPVASVKRLPCIQA
jgi:hypothetical protein